MVGAGTTQEPVEASLAIRPVATVTVRPSGSGSIWRRMAWVVRPCPMRCITSSADAAVPPEKVPCIVT